MADRADSDDNDRDDDIGREDDAGTDNAGTDNEEFEVTEQSAVDDTADAGGAADTEFLGLDSLTMMHSDDALLNALGGSESDDVGADVDERELSELLLAWRRDIDSEPMAELIDTDTALATINTAAAAQRPRRRTRGQRTLVPVAVAAAVLVIAFSGTGLAARSAEPGDALWGLTQVLYTEHAQSIQAAFSARGDLDTANYALAHGRFEKAADALDAAAQAIRNVEPGDHHQQLRAKHRKLTGQLPQQAGDPDSSENRGNSTSAATSSTTGSTTSSPQESSSSQESSESNETSEPTTSSQPETSPSTSSKTTSPSPSTKRSASESGSSSGILPNLKPSNQPQDNAPPAS